MGLSRRLFNKEFKLAAVRRLEQGVSIAEVARALEVNPTGPHCWRREFRQGPGNAFPGNGKQRWSEGRIAELERKIGQQALEIDFLKGCLQRIEEQRMLQAVTGNPPSTGKVEESDGDDGPTKQSISSPATAKNVFAVGGIENVRSMNIANGGNDPAGQEAAPPSTPTPIVQTISPVSPAADPVPTAGSSRTSSHRAHTLPEERPRVPRRRRPAAPGLPWTAFSISAMISTPLNLVFARCLAAASSVRATSFPLASNSSPNPRGQAIPRLRSQAPARCCDSTSSTSHSSRPAPP